MKTFFILVTLTIAGLCYHVNADDDDIFDDIFDDLTKRDDDDIFDDIFDVAKTAIDARDTIRSTVMFIFVIADTSRDGLLNALELSRVAKPKDGLTSLQKARQAVRLMDTNGDGLVSQSEMVTYIRNNGTIRK